MKSCIAVFLLVCLHHVSSQDIFQLSRLILDTPFRNMSFTLLPPTTPRLIRHFPTREPFTIPTPRMRVPSFATRRPWGSIRDQIMLPGVRDGTLVQSAISLASGN